MNYPNLNPYLNYSAFQPAPKYEIVHVNGRNGAEAFQMSPNSNSLLLDDTASIVWLVQTDGAGYKTLTPFDISPHQEVAPPDFKSLEERIIRLEERMNDEPYTSNNERKQTISQRGANKKSDEHNS